MKNKIIEEIMEIPKIALALVGIGILIIFISFLVLQNPFFLIVGVFAGIVFIFWGYDNWYKKLNDLTIRNISQKLDSLIYPTK